MMAEQMDPFDHRYPAEVEAVLADWGLSWFADHPCVPAADLTAQIKGGLDQEGLRAFLSERKEEIERQVASYTLEEGPVSAAGLGDGGTNQQLRVVLLGRAGEGKSSLGNLLLGQGRFQVYRGDAAGTSTIEHAASRDHNIRVIDTPGFTDTERVETDTETAKIFTFFSEGIHAFIVVMDPANPRITEKDLRTYQKLKKTYGIEMLQHTFLVFTKADTYFKADSQTLKAYLGDIESDQTDQTSLRNLLKIIGNRIVAVDNVCSGYKRQLVRRAMLGTIRGSAQGCYTIDDFRGDQENVEEDVEGSSSSDDTQEPSEQEAGKDGLDGQVEEDKGSPGRDKRQWRGPMKRPHRGERGEREKDRRRAQGAARAGREVVRAARIHTANYLATKSRKELITCKVDEDCRQHLHGQVVREVRQEVGVRVVHTLGPEEFERTVRDVVGTNLDRITDPSFLEKCKIILKSILSLNKPFKRSIARERAGPAQ